MVRVHVWSSPHQPEDRPGHHAGTVPTLQRLDREVRGFGAGPMIGSARPLAETKAFSALRIPAGRRTKRVACENASVPLRPVVTGPPSPLAPRMR